MATLDTPHGPRFNLKASMLPAFTALGLGVVFMRLWYLQIVRGEELSRLAVSRRTISVPIPSPRGQIVDRNGTVLAGVRPTLAAMVTPSEIEKEAQAVARLARILEVDAKELQADIEENRYRRYLPFVAKVGIRTEQAIAIEEQRAFMPGVFVRSESVRTYPLAGAGAHAVGYVSALDRADVERLTELGRDLPNFVGKLGIEKVYDLQLLGRSGEESVEVDARGRQVRPRTSEPPIPGDRLVLTLDAELQKYAAELMAGRRGAIAAIDPRNGEVLCLISSPTYDPNLFAQRISRLDWKRLTGHSYRPMHNRAAGSAYAPGSTFKIITLVAGIRSGVVSPGTTFVCDGAFRVGNKSFRCLGTHGRVDYETAVERSCNVFFAEVGSRAGREEVVRAAKAFGLGAPTGTDTLGERSGTVPDDSWLAEAKARWYPGDTVNLAVGQGYIGATPLQMANYAATIANRGRRFRPRILRALMPFGPDAETETIQPQTAELVGLDATWWERIVRAMTRVVDSGTGRAARIEGIAFGGKTGSAEQGRGKTPHGWFIGFAPADDPKIALAVVLESAGLGGRVAAPVARKIVERYLQGARSGRGV